MIATVTRLSERVHVSFADKFDNIGERFSLPHEQAKALAFRILSDLKQQSSLSFTYAVTDEHSVQWSGSAAESNEFATGLIEATRANNAA